MTETSDLIASVVARAPEWMRHDLLAKDKTTRVRAEEALAAMIAAALDGGPTKADDRPNFDQ